MSTNQKEISFSLNSANSSTYSAFEQNIKQPGIFTSEVSEKFFSRNRKRNFISSLSETEISKNGEISRENQENTKKRMTNLSSYILFHHEERIKLKKLYPHLKKPAMMKKIKSLWNKANSEVKQKYHLNIHESYEVQLTLNKPVNHEDDSDPGYHSHNCISRMDIHRIKNLLEEQERRKSRCFNRLQNKNTKLEELYKTLDHLVNILEEATLMLGHNPANVRNRLLTIKENQLYFKHLHGRLTHDIDQMIQSSVENKMRLHVLLHEGAATRLMDKVTDNVTKISYKYFCKHAVSNDKKICSFIELITWYDFEMLESDFAMCMTLSAERFSFFKEDIEKVSEEFGIRTLPEGYHNQGCSTISQFLRSLCLP